MGSCSLFCQADLRRKILCKLSHVLHGALTCATSAGMGLCGQTCRHFGCCGTPYSWNMGTFLNLGTFGCGSPILQQRTRPSNSHVRNEPSSFDLFHSASPDNMCSAEFTAVTDFYSNNLQGCLSHFPDCELMEIFLGISSLELRLKKTRLPLIKDGDREMIPGEIKFNSQ